MGWWATKSENEAIFSNPGVTLIGERSAVELVSSRDHAVVRYSDAASPAGKGQLMAATASLRFSTCGNRRVARALKLEPNSFLPILCRETTQDSHLDLYARMECIGAAYAADRQLDLCGLGVGSAFIIRKAKSLWEVVADSVGSDFGSEKQSYSLNFRQLEEKDTRPNAPFANGYSTRYGEI